MNSVVPADVCVFCVPQLLLSAKPHSIGPVQSCRRDHLWTEGAPHFKTNLSVYCYCVNIYLGKRSAAVIPVLLCCCSSIQPPSDWAVPQSSRLKYRQLFNSHDKMMSGHLTGTDTRHACFHWSPCNCCVCRQHCSPSFL